MIPYGILIAWPNVCRHLKFTQDKAYTLKNINENYRGLTWALNTN